MEKFSKYILVKLLAAGGMAEVFLAKEFGISGFQRILAIKRVLPHLSKDREFIEMFTAEARLSAQLNHPNIVQIYDFGLVDQSYYIAMEFIDGFSLNDVMVQMAEEGKPLPIDLCILIMAELCQGLGYAHNKHSLNNEPLHIVHRDISPKNVMLSYDGAVKLMDFGIAKAADQQRKETVAGVIKGKISYLSPEQVMAEPLDRRSDLFALGIVFFEMLTGRQCFTGDNEFAIIFKIRSANVPLASTINPEIPPDLAAIVAKMLHPDKELRYQTAEEILEDLNQLRYKHGYLATSNKLASFLKSQKGARKESILASLQKVNWAEIEQEFSKLPSTPEIASSTPLSQKPTQPTHFRNETMVDFDATPPKAKKNLVPVLLAASIFLLMTATGLFTFVLLPRLTEKPTPTPTIAPTATPIPTFTPTQTPAPPTATPTPTTVLETPTKTPIPHTPTPKPPMTGTVTISSAIAVELFKGSERLGAVGPSGFKTQLPPGSHSFVAAGYHKDTETYYRAQFSLEVKAGQTAAHAIKFPELGSLNITSALAAVVYINNVKIDDTPITKLNITSGTHEVRVEFKNGKSSRQAVNVRPGKFDKIFAKP